MHAKRHSPVFLYLGEWFSTRRGLATGILMAATGVGGAVIPPFLGFLLERVGFGWALRIWAGVYFILGALSLPYAKPRIPPPSRPILRESGMGQGGKNLKDRTWSWGTFKTATGRQVELWGNPLFLLVATTVTLHSMAIFPVSFYLPIYASTLRFPLLTSTLVLSAYNCRFSWFLHSHWISRRQIRL
ncbi:hypothetical protein BT69DRAFT_1341693 [Atractiella rhizophila]|nr:hypothetical protein BT69DRAFT_1341693 [Atractiella rhizophila]